MTLERKKALLQALKSDVELFGPAGNDMVRITSLEKEIAVLEDKE